MNRTTRSPGLSWACLAVLLFSWSVSGTARAQDERPLVLALFAPTAPLATAEARFAYVDKLTQHLAEAGVPAQGKVFARAADLEGAIRKGQVDLAILDAIYLAERGANYPVLAATTVVGEPALRWGLYTSLAQGNLGSLAGKLLSWAQVAGKEPSFLDNVLLDGELKVAQYFDLRPPAPDIAAAVSDVVLRHADCVFAPDAAVAGKGLRRVFDAGKVPNPALVLVQPRLPKETIARAQRALLSAAALGGLDGFRQSTAEPYRQLRQRISERGSANRLVMAEPQPLLTVVNSGMLIKEELAPDLLSLRGLILVPAGVP
jgi:hypothetical protein